MENIHNMVISDVHLESEDCRPDLLLMVLENYFYDELIIDGDLREKGEIINSKNLGVVEYLLENNKKIIYVDGNHDPAGKKFVGKILGIKTLKKYRWKVNGKKFCAIHGHQFDRFLFIFSEPLIDKMISKLFLLAQKIDQKKLHIAKWIDDFHNRLSHNIAKKAIKYAKKHHIDVIICGHTHKPAHIIDYDEKRRRTVEYFNCGDWTNGICSFITISEDGKAELHLVMKKPGTNLYTFKKVA